MTSTNYLGHLVGCLECVEFILYAAAAGAFTSDTICIVTGMNTDLVFIVDLALFAVCVAICAYGGRSFWRVNFAIGLVSLLVVIMFIFGSLRHVDFNRNASDGLPWFSNGMTGFMESLPYVLWFYIGVEGINNSTYESIEPKQSIPQGYVMCMSTLLATSVGVLLVSVSLAPIIEIQAAVSPLDFGFSQMFPGVKNIGLMLALPSMFATVFGFIFAYGKRVGGLGRSLLLPKLLGKSILHRGTSDVALVVSSMFSLTALFCYRYSKTADMFVLCLLASCFTYCMTLYSYIVFALSYGHFVRPFRSPLGIVGAALGILIFSLVFIACAFFQPTFESLIVFVVIVCGISLYYYAVVRHAQFFSPEEQAVLLPFYTAKCKLPLTCTCIVVTLMLLK